MKLDHSFTVPLPIDEAWSTLTDLEFIAPCLPGARITGRDGTDYLGEVRVKVGPVTTEFAGVARFAHQDPINYQATINAEGRDIKTSGSAKAVVNARLTSEGGTTVVSVETDLAISGKLAQFGRGAISDISAKLLDQFASNLDRRLTMLAESAVSASGDGVGRASPPNPEALDIAALVSVPTRVRVVGVLLFAAAALWWLSRRAARRSR